MKDLKQQFKDFRETTPKHIQWLLLGAAFVVVVILLTLVLGHKSDNAKSVDDANITVDFKTNPQTVNLTDIKVGSAASENINISVNTPVVIEDIDISGNDFTVSNTCDEIVTDFCVINVAYTPTSVQSEQDTTLKITWHIESQPDILNTEDVTVTFSSWDEEPVVEPEPIIEPEPVAEPEPIIEPEPVVEPDPAKDIREISQPNPFNEEKPVLTPEKCSEFAIPGYDQSGRQIGWIKPERGANYFHPFSDHDCSNPTGKYDFTTGIITSLKDGSKIGTDSDHIGYRHIRSRNLTMPQLSSPKTSATLNADGTFENAVWEVGGTKKSKRLSADWPDIDKAALLGSSSTEESVVSSRPYDRTFILRQFKPIPATIVSEVRADPSVYGCSKISGASKCDPEKNYSIPVRATVDRNVYSDDGRTIILPTGTLLMGYLDGDLPGPYQAFGRMNIKWYQFIRPDGVEFNFGPNQDPYSADAQGRMGVPGHGSTDYVEQMVMPILTSLVPAAVNMIAPIADTVINQIDLDNNTIVQSGTIRSSEMAKQDIINTWNKVTQKLLVDAIDNTVPPFSIAAGTRINVFSPVDLIVTCGTDGLKDGDKTTKKCAFTAYNDKNKRRKWSDLQKNVSINTNDSSWVGQVRSFNLREYCTTENGKITIGPKWAESGYDYRTVLMYCESQNYEAKNNAKQAVYNQNQQAAFQNAYGTAESRASNPTSDQAKAYNTEVLGLTYDEDGNIMNPFESTDYGVADETITCEDGNAPDTYGCCTGETYTDNGPSDPNDPDSPHVYVCCPPSGDCFPPIEVN